MPPPRVAPLERTPRNGHSRGFNPESTSLLRAPGTLEPLDFVSEGKRPHLRGARSGCTFAIRHGIVDFLGRDELDRQNERYRKVYDRIAPAYDMITRSYAALRNGGDRNRRMEYLSELEIRPGDSVLEVSVGTGANLRYLPKSANYYGLDISMGMLRRAAANLRDWRRHAELACANGEELPYADNSFDVVFHVCGINFFNDKAKALREMVRVAKPGSKIMVTAESTRLCVERQKKPFYNLIYRKTREPISAPVELLPPGMLEVQVKDKADGHFWCMTFRKP